MFDDFVVVYSGNVFVVVFVDFGGVFNNDIECVNGWCGNVVDYLIKDVVFYMVLKFGVSFE